MNFNIFSPKGKIDQSTFIIYYILLMILFFVIGFLGFPFAAKHNLGVVLPNILLFIINLLIFFNYKKRIFDSFNKLGLAIVTGLILTADHVFIPFILDLNIKNPDILFFSAIVLVFCVQPIIATILPSKKTPEK